MKAYILRVTDAYIIDLPDNNNEDKVKLFVTNYLHTHLRDIPFKPLEHYIIMTENQFVSDQQLAKIMDLPNVFGLEELKGDSSGNFSSG